MARFDAIDKTAFENYKFPKLLSQLVKKGNDQIKLEAQTLLDKAKGVGVEKAKASDGNKLPSGGAPSTSSKADVSASTDAEKSKLPRSSIVPQQQGIKAGPVKASAAKNPALNSSLNKPTAKVSTGLGSKSSLIKSDGKSGTSSAGNAAPKVVKTVAPQPSSLLASLKSASKKSSKLANTAPKTSILSELKTR